MTVIFSLLFIHLSLWKEWSLMPTWTPSTSLMSCLVISDVPTLLVCTQWTVWKWCKLDKKDPSICPICLLCIKRTAQGLSASSGLNHYLVPPVALFGLNLSLYINMEICITLNQMTNLQKLLFPVEPVLSRNLHGSFCIHSFEYVHRPFSKTAVLPVT